MKQKQFRAAERRNKASAFAPDIAGSPMRKARIADNILIYSIACINSESKIEKSKVSTSIRAQFRTMNR